MDSFYDQPRNAPKPTNVNKLAGPLIPEVSIIQPLETNVPHRTYANVGSYNVWRARNVSEPPQSDKENFRPSRQFSDPSGRKHVRFESPTLHRSNSGPRETALFCRNEQSKNLDARALEEIYMANIPNRNLDLSVLDLSANKKNVSDDNRNVIIGGNNCYDIYNYKRVPEDVPEIKEDVKQIKTYADFRKQNYDCINTNRTSNDELASKDEHLFSRDLCNKLIENDHRRFRCDNYDLTTRRQYDDEPTTRDLLKVIQQQNEQILLLQKQMAYLLETKANQKQIENTTPDPLTANLPIDDQERYRKPKKGPLSKIAIDVMTSFEVSFRPQNQRNRPREIDDSPKIQEVKDVADDTTNVLDGIKKSDKFDANDDVSLSLQEPLKVTERCLSPEQSIHVEMQDYSSDEEDTDSTLGWTLYNNIMGQVNNIFKNSHQADSDQPGPEVMKDKTLKRVKEATMKHLKSIGVNLPLIEENNIFKEQPKCDDEFNSSEVSFAVKQLLMKYLPDEQLAKLTYKETKQPNENFIKRRPEFSFATVQYMKKYNLLASDGTKGQLGPVKPNSPKILDVTALKQQPKLL